MLINITFNHELLMTNFEFFPVGMQSIEECRVQVAICLHILRSFGSAPRFYRYAASMTGIFDRTRLHP